MVTLGYHGYSWLPRLPGDPQPPRKIFDVSGAIFEIQRSNFDESAENILLCVRVLT
jgi:hypothetical protein